MGWNEAIFNTGNQYVKCRVKYLVTRKETSYTLAYEIYLYRTNTGYNGTPTHGSMSNYTVYVNGNAIYSSSHSKVTVPNGNTTGVKITEWERDISLDPFSTGAGSSLGFSCSGVRTGLTVDYQTVAFTPGAYATKVGAPDLELKDTQRNSFLILSKSGSNGDNNDVTGLHIYYTLTDMDDKVYVDNKGLDAYVNGEKQPYTKEVFVDRPTKVRAQALTIDSYHLTEAYPKYTAVGSDVKTTGVTYYSPPNPMSHIEMECYKDSKLEMKMNKLTPQSFIKCSWSTAPTTYGFNNGCRVYLFVKRSGSSNWVSDGSNYDGEHYFYNLFYNDSTKNSALSNVGITFKNDSNKRFSISFTAQSLNLEKGDSFYVGVQPFQYSTDYEGKDFFIAAESKTESEPLPVQSNGVMSVKVNDTWEEGQVWINTNNGWQEASGVYLKTTDGWKESI